MVMFLLSNSTFHVLLKCLSKEFRWFVDFSSVLYRTFVLILLAASWSLRWNPRLAVLGSRWFAGSRCNKQFFAEDIWPQHVDLPDCFRPHRQHCGYWYISQGQRLSPCQWWKGMYTLNTRCESWINNLLAYCWRVCLPWLPGPLIDSKLTWYLTSQCHRPCGYAESRQTDLEAKNHHSNQAKVV